jgi:hypothetical protein
MRLMQVFYDLILVLSCSLAFLKGGTTERRVAWMAIAASVASFIVSVEGKQVWSEVHSGPILIDFLMLAGLAVIALRTDRFWPLWATAFQLVAVSTHVAMAVSPDVVPRAYALALGFWAYPILFLMAAASWKAASIQKSKLKSAF